MFYSSEFIIQTSSIEVRLNVFQVPKDRFRLCVGKGITHYRTPDRYIVIHSSVTFFLIDRSLNKVRSLSSIEKNKLTIVSYIPLTE